MKWYIAILIKLSNDTRIEEGLLLEITELVQAMKDGKPYVELLTIVNNNS